MNIVVDIIRKHAQQVSFEDHVQEVPRRQETKQVNIIREIIEVIFGEFPNRLSKEDIRDFAGHEEQQANRE